MRKIKIGIDVGGTFTHAVAVNIINFEIIGKACVPTTHRAKEGVAKGVVDSMFNLLNVASIQPEEIVLIAHSTTQATNALLEGDVAPVGIIGLGKGFEGKIGKKECNPKQIELSPGKYLKTYFRFVEIHNPSWKNSIPRVIKELLVEGAEVIVATEVFGVDNPENEIFVAEVCHQMGILCTAASKISRLYGLRVRTRTAVINASMMPKMLETANMTEKAIRDSGIKAPLMVMRSDGGIMDINEMRRRPILTMLSGPAAGVAAALMYVKISDGIFLEVGGTSTDISVIKNGKPQIKSAQIGKNKLFVRTLDVRTLGIGGGSVPRIKDKKIIDVGPRSAHIANLEYVSFAKNVSFRDIELGTVTPLQGDPDDYLSINIKGITDKKFTITPTGASYFLNLVKETGHGLGNLQNIKECFESLSEKLHRSAESIAQDILTYSANKIKPVIKQLIREYKLDENLVEFVGGGGGASALIPFTAKFMNVPHRIAENSEVISAIGAALGIIRDSVEKNIINPTETDIINLRQEAVSSVLAMGASPQTIEVTIEIDNQNKKVIATAMGSSEFRTKELGIQEMSEEQIRNKAALSLKCSVHDLYFPARTEFFYVATYLKKDKRLFGLLNRNELNIRLIDREGTIRLQINDGITKSCKINEVKTELSNIIAEYTTFGDAGALIPDLFIISGPKIIDLTGLISEPQILSMADIELKNVPGSMDILLMGAKKK